METILLIVFAIGYTAIILEHKINVNKAASALCTGIVAWSVLAILNATGTERMLSDLERHLSDICSILIFLIGAMTIVQIIDMHGGFRIVTDRIRTTEKRKLLWIVSLLTFFLSAVLDNLTTTIVMVSLTAKLIANRNDRLIFAAMIIIAANAGGAWTPIGDVTTTMLWVSGNISAGAIITSLFLPSLTCILVPLIAFSFMSKGNVEPPVIQSRDEEHALPDKLSRSILIVGVGALIAVPIFKTITHLPPYMGVTLGLGLIWIYTELIYRKYSRNLHAKYSVTTAISRIDMGTIAFFMGILLAVAALQTSGILSNVALWLNEAIGNQSIIVLVIGFISAIVDNVPLVAAAQGMYDFPINDYFWLFLSYAAGTGGSVLVIGSAAGVAAMGMEKIDFIWYLKRISVWVILGYLIGALVFIGNHYLLFG
ncbi:MAG: sodium:proton antiporter NhaD [Prevotellaceae bacterium]|jgi:Na+/H+ antiporter NhaD/arsenite permease-like protein|nr:sodium:proton antiporter NhaD [Prevotellaceae bacterium]